MYGTDTQLSVIDQNRGEQMWVNLFLELVIEIL